MRLIYAYGQPGYRQYFFEISHDSRISFFEWPGVEAPARRRHGEPASGPFTFDHFSIGVPDEKALWEIMGRLDGADFGCSDVIDHGYFLSIYTYDPNNIPIEFTCNAAGINVLEQADLRDHVAQTEALMHSDPNPKFWPPPDPIPVEEQLIVAGEGSEHFEQPSWMIRCITKPAD
ncbi:putative glyoxalase/bleomycin resistance protein/dioxygenase [Magnetofaba australis IT-1]|uniref:Putative glyoxalase/bleomycin resistance protein/dioxygenase n=2 Tax=Magnetofaba TaxID=1472292 RepID=A0A1Y2K4T5_9PROT|nr:putative glyoxalase/bleomycin resistance protein/dioxygenase [Magnetofaba australis IT-1]